MRVKGSLVRTRLDFLRERFGSDGLDAVVETLTEDERRQIRSALPASWVPSILLNHLDAAIVREQGGGSLDICREIGAFSARRNLTTLYHMFVDQAGGDPVRLVEALAGLHSTFYDWGSLKVYRTGEQKCRVEADYAGGVARTNCPTGIGFYAEALRLAEVRSAEVQESACQASGAPLCVSELGWEV